jgi:hypothetical protein
MVFAKRERGDKFHPKGRKFDQIVYPQCKKGLNGSTSVDQVPSLRLACK